MGMDYHGNIIDFFGGKKDIENHIIRTVGNPFDRFDEDFIRILRAVRFASRYTFHLDTATADAISACGECLLQLSPERIQTELAKMAGEGGKPFANVLMRELNVLRFILPEVDILFDLPHSDTHHPEGVCKNSQCKNFANYTANHAFCNTCPNAFNSVGKHVAETLRVCSSNDIYQLFALLFHDIGKGITYLPLEKNGEIKHTYYRHDTASKEVITAIAKRLKWSHKLTEIVIFCAKNHMILHQAIKIKPYTLLTLMENKYFSYAVETSFCDDKARCGLFKQEEWDKLLAYLDDFRNTFFAFSRHITGKHIMEITGIQQGIRLGKILKAVKKHAANHKILDTETLDKTIRFYEKCIK
jgi:tRNA nucleotidyltransferase/poly(A) polymerase